MYLPPYSHPCYKSRCEYLQFSFTSAQHVLSIDQQLLPESSWSLFVPSKATNGYPRPGVMDFRSKILTIPIVPNFRISTYKELLEITNE